MSTEQNGSKAGTPSPERLGSAPFSDAEILRMCMDAGFTVRQMRELCITRWEDGIDIEVPTFPLKRFVEIVLQNTSRHLRPETKDGE